MQRRYGFARRCGDVGYGCQQSCVHHGQARRVGQINVGLCDVVDQKRPPLRMPWVGDELGLTGVDGRLQIHPIVLIDHAVPLVAVPMPTVIGLR